MELQVNGQAKDVKDRMTVSELLDALDVARQRVAVEVNRELVPRSQHETTKLTAGDKIEIVTLVGGG